jgi:poly(A) polymerase Pap1
LNTYRDTAYLLKTSPDISSYRIAHRFLSLYLKRRGLYSAKFGYLGGIHLSLMLSRVFKLIPLAMNAPGDPKPTPAIVIRTFFKYYATFSWATEIVTDPGLDTKPTRTARDAVFIHTIHTPTARPNVASSCTRLSGQTFSYEFSLAAKMLDEGNWDWCLQPRAVVVSEFLNTFGAFVRISVDIWDINDIGGDKGREVVGGLESKMTRLLVGLGRLPNIDARIWPARFRSLTEKAKKEDEENTRENQFKGYYLVGVSAREEDTEQKKLLTGKIIATVRDFETSVKDSKEFQGENVWLSMDLVPKKKITEMNLSIDERDWGAIPAKMVSSK